MRQISSRATWCYKRGLPTVWFIWWGLFLIGPTFWGSSSLGGLLLLWIAVGSMILFGFVIFRKELYPLADGVFEDVDGLVVFHRNTARRFRFREIAFIHQRSYADVVVTFAYEGGFTEKFQFVPERNRLQGTWGPNLGVESLLARVMRAHRQLEVESGNSAFAPRKTARHVAATSSPTDRATSL